MISTVIAGLLLTAMAGVRGTLQSVHVAQRRRGQVRTFSDSVEERFENGRIDEASTHPRYLR